MEKTITIACLGSGKGQPGEPVYNAMERVGAMAAMRNIRIITGGFGGAGMEAAASGATSNGGKAIGYTMLGLPGNDFLSEVVDCSTWVDQPLPKEVQYGVRLGRLLQADGFILAAGGGMGTMVELMAIMNLNTKMWREQPKRFAILRPEGFQGVDWSYALFNQLERGGFLPAEEKTRMLFTTDPEEALNWVIDAPSS